MHFTLDQTGVLFGSPGRYIKHHFKGSPEIPIQIQFCDFARDFCEMGPYMPIFGNFHENKTGRKQASDISFYTL